MIIRLKKDRDGRAALQCVRTDASATWKRYADRQAQFLARHDLLHFAVETELGSDNGFFGLVAQGWNIEDMDGKGARGPLPAQSVIIEHLVGLVTMDVAGAGTPPWDVDTLNAQLAAIAAEHGLGPVRPLTTADLSRVRSRARTLLERWDALTPGSTLELQFAPVRHVTA
jgi:hypothetical protein